MCSYKSSWIQCKNEKISMQISTWLIIGSLTLITILQAILVQVWLVNDQLCRLYTITKFPLSGVKKFLLNIHEVFVIPARWITKGTVIHARKEGEEPKTSRMAYKTRVHRNYPLSVKMKLSLISIAFLATFPLFSNAENFGRRGYPCKSDADCGQHLSCVTDMDGQQICRRDFCRR